MNKLSQQQRILELLQDGAWHCSSEFYRLFIADPRRRICDLKEKGYKLVDRICEAHPEHTHSKQWMLVRDTLF